MDATPEFLDALRKGDVDRVVELVRADPALANARTKSGASAVLLATYLGQKAVVDALLANGADLGIHEASAIGRVDRVQELVATDPGLVNAISPEGFPPMGLAAYLGRRDVVEFLISRGAEVNFASRETGFTALTGAVSNRHADVVELLLRHGANADYQYEGTFTPLLSAVANGDARTVRLLLDSGADPNLGAMEGKTAYEVAMEKGNAEIAELLRQRGAGGGTAVRRAEGTAPLAAAALAGPDPKAVILKLQRVLNLHDPEGLVALVDPDYESEQPAHPDRAFRGRELVRKNWTTIFGRVPDFRADVVRMAAEGDTVWTEWHWHGVRVDGTKFDLKGVTLFRVRDGRIVAGRLYMEPVQLPKKEGPYGEAP